MLEHSVLWRPCAEGKAQGKRIFQGMASHSFSCRGLCLDVTYRWQMVGREHTTGVSIPLTGKHERCLWYHKGQLSLLANVGVGEGSVTGWL